MGWCGVAGSRRGCGRGSLISEADCKLQMPNTKHPALRRRDPIGVMVVSPAYREVANRAEVRFRKYAGMDVHVVRCGDEEGFEAKLGLDRVRELEGRPIVFFDADWWLLRPAALREMALSGQWLGVRDPTVVHEHCFPCIDCQENGLQADRYLNTGFFICDLGRPEHCLVFATARRSWRAVQAGRMATADPTDQFHLNRGLLECGVQAGFLPMAYNFFLFAATEGCCEIPREIVGLHGAGAQRADKLEELRVQSRVFGRAVAPMKMGAVTLAYTRAFEL